MKKLLSLLILLSVAMPLALNAGKHDGRKKRENVGPNERLRRELEDRNRREHDRLMALGERYRGFRGFARMVINGETRDVIVIEQEERHPETENDASFIHKNAKKNKKIVFTDPKSLKRNLFGNNCNPNSFPDKKDKDDDNFDDDDFDIEFSEKTLPVNGNK